MPEITIKFSNSKRAQIHTVSWELLTDENLRKIEIRRGDIKKIEQFFEVPGVLYTEPRVASKTHPCGGSVGVWIYTKDGNRTSVQDILYYDPNIFKTHCDGLPHWNHERRFIDRKGRVETIKKGIEHHVIEDSDLLTIHFGGRQKTVSKGKK